jgi:GNAT superfamily N-acetyltransferase/ribosomal protein S27AE
MEIREAELADRPQLRAITEQSFRFSYSLSPERIEAILENLFADDTLASRIDDPDVLLLVAEGSVAEGGGPEDSSARTESDERSADDGAGDENKQVVGFVDVDLAAARLHWLHVDPDARGDGVGTALFEGARDAVEARGDSLVARVLEQASEGGEFCTQFGFSRTGSARLEFDDERFTEDVYGTDADETVEPDVDVPLRIRVDNDELVVDRREEIPGTDAPFFSLYRAESSEDRYGFFCVNCGGIDVSADGLDRLECSDCGNEHLAENWDDAYL